MYWLTGLLLPLLWSLWPAGDPTPLRTDYDVRLLAASRSGPQMEGRKLYAQRCALCHIGSQTEVPYGGWLNAERIDLIGEETARLVIMEGVAGMPGWKYTLRPQQVDKIIAWLKTVRTAKKVEPFPTREAVIER